MTTTSTPAETSNVVLARERIAALGGAALLAAGLLLVGAILPAEFGVDPLGIGATLGLTALGDVQQQLTTFQTAQASAAKGPAVIQAQPRPYQQETVQFTLAPHESIEYKYRLDKGSALLYSWKATAPVNYELHAEPDGAPRGYAESYEKRNDTAAASGTLTAPFSGIHGWYWENPGNQTATVTLSAAGFYKMSHEFKKDKAPRTKFFQTD